MSDRAPRSGSGSGSGSRMCPAFGSPRASATLGRVTGPRHRIAALAALVALGLGAGVATSAQEDFLLTIRVSYLNMRPGRPFEWQVALTREAARDLEFDPRKQAKPYLDEAHRALAKREGYLEKLYGKDYYLQVKVTEMNWEIFDVRRRRVTLAGKAR